jgi:hypothetical protein
MTDTGNRSKSTDEKQRFLAWCAALYADGKQPRVTKDLFVSAKTTTAIPVRDPARRAALIQASLDGRVRSIAYIASAQAGSEPVNLDAVIVQRDDGRFLLDIVPTRRIRTPEEQRSAEMALVELGVTPMVLTAEDIIREPPHANTQLVWAHRETPVPVGLRMRALQTLLDEGPMPLGELLRSIRSEVDPVPAVMALACANLVYLDLVSQPLSPTTVVGCCTQTEMPLVPPCTSVRAVAHGVSHRARGPAGFQRATTRRSERHERE